MLKRQHAVNSRQGTFNKRQPGVMIKNRLINKYLAAQTQLFASGRKDCFLLLSK